MYQFSLLFLKFILFSMIGYVVEMIFCAIIDKKIANRGFLCGPIIPIYGFGSLILIWILKPFYKNVFFVILLGMIITGALEYFTSYVLEKVFHNKWWDYSQEKFNLNGRICLKNLICFGIGSPLILYILDPYMMEFLLQFKDEYLIAISWVLFFIFLFDVIYSCVVAYNLRNRIIIVEDLKNEKLSKIPGMFEKMLTKRMKSFKKLKRTPKRLLKAFPTLFQENQKEFELMKKIEQMEKEKRKKKKKRKQ